MAIKIKTHNKLLQQTHTAALDFVYFAAAQFYTKTLSAVCAAEQGVRHPYGLWFTVMKKKKRNKKQGDRKPVDQWVRFQAKAGVDGIIEFDFSGGAGSVFSNQILPNTSYAYNAYQRDSGKHKVINQSPGQLKSTRGSLKDNIESSFTSIAGIDTNDYSYKGKRVSIVASFCSMHFAKSGANGFMIDQLPAFVVENIPENFNSEIIGWHLFFEHTIPLLNLLTRQLNK